MYVWFPVFDPRWSDMTILYAMWYDAMALAYKLLCSSLLLKSLFFFCMYGHFAKCTNQDSNSVYAGTNLWHKRWYDSKMIPIWYGIYAMEGVDQWSLMCTSNVAGNTQMASLNRQVTQNGLGVNNAIARGIYNGVVEVTVLGDDERRCCQCRPIPN